MNYRKICQLIIFTIVLAGLTGCLFELPISNQEKLVATWYKPYSNGLEEVEYNISPWHIYLKDATYCNSNGYLLTTKSGTYNVTDKTITAHLSNGDVLFNYYFSSTDNYLHIYNNQVSHVLKRK